MLSLLTCMRRGQESLLPLCSVTPPKEPAKQNRPPSILAYWFEAFPNMREGLCVANKTQMGEDWLYHIEIPQPLTAHRRGFDLKVKKVGAEYRIDADLGLLKLQFFD